MDTPEAVSADHWADLPVTWFRRRRRGRVRRAVNAIAALFGGILVYSLTAVLLLPPLFFLVAGLWSVIAYTRTLISLWDLFKSGQLQAFLHNLGGVELPVRLALASGAYFALLFALIVICSGLLARGMRLLLLVPGLLFAVPAVLVFVIDVQGASDVVTPTLGLSEAVVLLATTYALVDLAVLAGILTDLRPRMSCRRRRSMAMEQHAVELPVLRFGPAVADVPFVVQPIAAASESIDGPPSDPMMTATVAKALADSFPVAIIPVTPGQRDEVPATPAAHDVAEVSEP